MEETIVNNIEEAKRPTFLTVLCILSFISVGFGFFSSIINVSKNSDEEMEKLQELQEQMGDSGMMGTIMEGSMAALEHKLELNILSIVCSLLTFAGVFMMWKLNKKGFWVYTASQLISLLGTFAILGMGLVSIMTIGFGGFFSVLFVVLYALNLKYMN